MPGKRDDDEKPDFLDLDKDGDKDESMKKAAEDKEELDEGGCPSMDREGETAMMVVGDEPDMMGPEMEMGVEAKLDMILDKLGALMGGDMMEDELDERRARGRKGPSTRTDDARLREAVRKALKASTNMVSEREDENLEDIKAISKFIEDQPEWDALTDVMSRGDIPSAVDVYHLAGQFYDDYGKDWRQHEQDIIKDLEHMSKRNEDRKLREAVRKALKASIKKA